MVTAATAEGPRRHGIKAGAVLQARLDASTNHPGAPAAHTGTRRPCFTNNLQFSYQNSRIVFKDCGQRMLVTEGDELLPPYHPV